ncbi:unnamed protein product [Ectocarpus sp. 12 AP-2014]
MCCISVSTKHCRRKAFLVYVCISQNQPPGAAKYRGCAGSILNLCVCSRWWGQQTATLCVVILLFLNQLLSRLALVLQYFRFLETEYSSIQFFPEKPYHTNYRCLNSH